MMEAAVPIKLRGFEPSDLWGLFQFRTRMSILVSPVDGWRLTVHEWTITSNGYVGRYVWDDGVCKAIYLHRAIMTPAEGLFVDHIDGNKLNNTRENLRVCTPSENAQNRKIQKNNKTGFKGVYPYKGRFRAQVRAAGKKHLIGAYDTPEEAHAAYVAAAFRFHGEFARAT